MSTAAPARRSSRVDRRAVALTGAALIATVLLVLNRGWVGVVVPLALAAVALVAMAVAALGRDPQVDEWSFAVANSQQLRGSDTRLGTLRALLDRSSGADATRQLQELLGSLAEHRLRDRHGVSRASDPARAEALLGADFAAYLAQHPAPRLTTERVARYVSHLENL